MLKYINIQKSYYILFELLKSFLPYFYFVIAVNNQSLKLIIPPPHEICATSLSFAQPVQKVFTCLCIYILSYVLFYIVLIKKKKHTASSTSPSPRLSDFLFKSRSYRITEYRHSPPSNNSFFCSGKEVHIYILKHPNAQVIIQK